MSNTRILSDKTLAYVRTSLRSAAEFGSVITVERKESFIILNSQASDKHTFRYRVNIHGVMFMNAITDTISLEKALALADLNDDDLTEWVVLYSK